MMDQNKRPKYLVYFVVAFITCYLTQEVLLNRLTDIGIGYITGGTFIYFTSPLIMDVVAEVYGYKVAKNLLWCGLISLLFFAFCIGICLMTPYPIFWKKTAIAYAQALDSVVRTAVVSVITVFLGQLVNVYFISKWKVLTNGRYFWLRSVGSSILGDSVTVILTTLGTFWGRIPPGVFIHNIVPELVIMVLFSALGALPATYIAYALKKAEGFDVYDTNISYNPFKAWKM